MGVDEYYICNLLKLIVIITLILFCLDAITGLVGQPFHGFPMFQQCPIQFLKPKITQ